MTIRSTGETKVVVLADGCGSQPHSEIGADIGCNLTASLIMEQLERGELDWAQLTQDLCEKLEPIIKMYDDGNFDEALVQRFLFTLIAVVVHEDVVQIASFGDGVVIADDNIIHIKPPVENTPPYVGYLFRKDSPYHGKGLSQHLQFRMVYNKPLRNIKKSLIIATDGLLALPLDEIHHPAFLKKANALQIWLNTHATERAEDNQIIPGICSDDVTMVLIRTEEAQAYLLEGRSEILKLKKEINTFLSELGKTHREWRNFPLLEEEAVAELASYTEQKTEYEEMAKELDAVLDCQNLLDQVEEKLKNLEELPYKKEIKFFALAKEEDVITYSAPYSSPYSKKNEEPTRHAPPKKSWLSFFTRDLGGRISED
jgi:hypothetical protein